MAIPPHCYEPHNHLPYIYVLYQFDCLHVTEVAKLLGATDRTAGVYLNALADMGYAKSYRQNRYVYWHLVTKGISYMEKILKETLPIHYGTAHPKKDTKRNLRHDMIGTQFAMKMVEDTIDKEQGLLTWAGPTITKTLYPRSRSAILPNGDEIKQAMPHYMPDLYIEYFTNWRWGCLNIEIDASTQKFKDWQAKVQKCRGATVFGYYRSNTSWLTVAFITNHTWTRCQNMMSKLVDEFVGHENPVLVITTTVKRLQEEGPFAPIWLSNDGTDTEYALSDLTIGDWTFNKEPLLIGTSNWLNTLRSGGINLYTYYNPYIEKVRPWDIYIPQEERRAKRIEEARQYWKEYAKKQKKKKKQIIEPQEYDPSDFETE